MTEQRTSFVVHDLLVHRSSSQFVHVGSLAHATSSKGTTSTFLGSSPSLFLFVGKKKPEHHYCFGTKEVLFLSTPIKSECSVVLFCCLFALLR